MNTSTELPPLQLAPLFRDVGARLHELLCELTPEDWQRPTSSSRRTVKDVASHLLDGTLRRLSAQRDGYTAPGGGPRGDESLMDFLNRLNDEWEVATRRLSPAVLMDMLETADVELAELFESLDPMGEAIYPVAWAGEERSRNWMDVAREYTEKWHHTQQIFEATARPSTIVERRLFHPCLDTFFRALPFTFRDVRVAVGTVVQVRVRGDAGGEWNLVRGDGHWVQQTFTTKSAASVFSIDQDSAWKLFTKRTDRQTAMTRFSDIEISGNIELGSHLLDMVSVMA